MCIFGALLFVLVIPILINLAYSKPAFIPWLAMSWDAKDALAFYGSILGAGATIIALVATIRFTTNSQKKERKLSIKPRLDSKWKNITREILSFAKGDDYIFINCTDDKIVSSIQVPDDLINLVEKQKKANTGLTGNASTDYLIGECKKAFAKAYTEYQNSHFVLLYEVSNYGANAIEINFRINEDMVYMPFCIGTNEKVKFIIAFDKKFVGNSPKRINIELIYTDVCSLGWYSQEESFILGLSNTEFQLEQALETKLNSPKEIPKPDTIF